MAVYKYDMLDALRQAIRDVGNKLVSHLYVDVSERDYIEAVIEPQHMEPIDAVLALGIKFDRSFIANLQCFADPIVEDGAPVKIMAEVRFPKPLSAPLPAYADKPHASAPDWLIARLADFANERVRIGRALGFIDEHLNDLNSQCGNEAAFQNMMPCLTTLLSNMGENHKARANRINASKRVGTLAMLPRDTKQTLLTASALVNAAGMVDQTPAPEIVRGFVRISFPCRVVVLEAGVSML